MSHIAFALVLAQVTAPVAAQPAWLTALLQYVVAPMLPLIGAALVGLLAKGVAFLHSKEKDSKALTALAVGADVVNAFVAHAEVAILPLIADAAKDGTITAAEGQAIKAKTLQLLKEQMPAALQATLGAVLGPALDTWLSGKLEQAVSQQGAVAAMGGPTAPAPALPPRP